MQNTRSTKFTLKDDCLIINIKYEGVFHLEDSESKKDHRHCIFRFVKLRGSIIAFP